MRRYICKHCAEKITLEIKSVGVLLKGVCFYCKKEFEGKDLRVVYES